MDFFVDFEFCGEENSINIHLFRVGFDMIYEWFSFNPLNIKLYGKELGKSLWIFWIYD